MIGRTRVHLGSVDVDGLGQFLEVEVVLENQETAASALRWPQNLWLTSVSNRRSLLKGVILICSLKAAAKGSIERT